MAESQDAIEVAQVLSNKLRPVYTFAAVLMGVVGVGVTHIWNLAGFINRDAVHEQQQDDNQSTMQKRLDVHEKSLTRVREQNLDTLRLLINDLALLRSVQLQTLPKSKREQVRRDFEVQRIQSIDLLTNAQK